MAVVTELVTKFAFTGSVDTLSKYNQNLSAGIKLVAGYAAAVIGATAAIAAFTTSTLSSLSPIVNLSNQTGIAVDRIQALGYAASVSGSSAQELQNTLQSFGRNVADAALKGSENFARIGVSVRNANGQIKSTDALLFEVGNRLKNMNISDIERQNLAASLGINPSVVALITKSGDEVSILTNRAKAFGLITAEQTRQIDSYNNSITTLNFALSGMRNQIAIGLAPAMQEFIDYFVDALAANKDWIQNGIRVVSEFLLQLSEVIGRLIIFIGDLVSKLFESKLGFIALGAAIWFLLSPAILIAAGIAALLLIFDDLIVAFNGGKSVIRDFFLEFFGFDIQPVLKDIVDAINQVFDVIGEVINAVIAIATLDFEGLYKAIVNIFKPFVNSINAYIVKPFVDAFNGIGKYISNVFSSIFNWLGNKIKSLIPESWLSFLGLGSSSDESSQPQTEPYIPIGESNSFLNNNQSISNNNQISIEVKADNPQAAGDAVLDALQTELLDTNAQTSVGGR